MNNYFKNHPLYIKQLKNIKKTRKNAFYKYKNEIGKTLKHLNKKIKILEIWFWQWNFTYFCKENGFKNYTWIDIDDTFIKELKKEFKNYNFLKEDIIKYLQKNKWFDVIFMSHVFEHLNEKEAGDTVKLIYSALNKWGYRINYMPNADSHLNVWTLRYIDITHKKIYNSNSFEQILSTNIKKKLQTQHFNTLPGINPYLKWIFKIIHPIFFRITKLYYYGMWYTFPKIYTSEVLSIIKK